jgi:hypothetical protein
MTGQAPRRQRLPLTPRRDRDPGQRERAARLGQAFPHWLIHWGTWSRRYWAYPKFRAPRGTILCAADPADLAAQIRQVQAETMNRRPVTP